MAELAAVGSAVRRATGVKRYHQVYLTLLRRIHEGTYARGASLPSEQALCTQLQVARVTLRTAMARLEREGYIVRSRGARAQVCASGVATLRDTASRVVQLLAEPGRLATETVARTLSFSRIATPKALQASASAGPPRCLRVERVRYLLEMPFIYETAFMPESGRHRLTRAKLGHRTLNDVLEERGCRIARAHQSTTARLASPAVARTFGLEAGAPVFCVESISFDVGGVPLLYQRLLYHPDRFELRAVVERPPSHTAAPWIPLASPSHARLLASEVDYAQLREMRAQP